jgi:hypothetical protein
MVRQRQAQGLHREPGGSRCCALDVRPQLKPKASIGAPGAGLTDRNARMMSEEPPSRQRCGARLKHAPGNFCARYVAPGKTRCNLHGGKSTGPRKT